MRLSVRAAAAAAFMLGSPASADAFFAPDSASRPAYFSGAGCGATSSATLAIPRSARSIEFIEPAIGDRLYDINSDAEVAEVRRVGVARGGRTGRVMKVVVVGAHDACAASAGTAWQTDELTMTAEFKRPVTVFAGGYRLGPRPRRVYFGAHEVIVKLRWSTWGRSVARGRGVYPVNDCIPYCAAGSYTRHRVAVSFSKIRSCNGRYKYLRFRYRFLDRIPSRWRRGGVVPFGYLCR